MVNIFKNEDTQTPSSFEMCYSYSTEIEVQLYLIAEANVMCEC